MERKTKVNAETDSHDLVVTREFELPVELLFRAHTEPGIFEQWMSHEYGTTKVLKLECRKHGGWEFETRDAAGTRMFGAHGTIHEFIPDVRITRTFEMDNSPYDVQLEFLEFEKLDDDTSRLTMHTIFRSVAARDALLKQPFAYGLNLAHNRLQEVVGRLK
ncbi:MAG TPA: SRPBCC domain-containing protein [Ohtaekwangia sp.]|nr:SRPBCC domain-containing protein [Ohtaekwangia sp.]